MNSKHPTSDENPYQPPLSKALLVADDVVVWEHAEKWRRFGTLVVDYVGFLLLSMLVGVVLAIAFGEAGVATLERLPDIVLGLILMTSYYVFFEGIWARTPGKLIFGTFVVNASGGRPLFGQIVKRTLCRFIPFEPFSFFGETGWHDSISQTRVVRRRKTPVI